MDDHGGSGGDDDDNNLVSDIEDNLPTEEIFLRAPRAVRSWKIISMIIMTLYAYMMIIMTMYDHTPYLSRAPRVKNSVRCKFFQIECQKNTYFTLFGVNSSYF